MVLNVERNDTLFRVITQAFSTSWLPDTAENRKVTVVFLRLLQTESGKPLFTLQDLSVVVNSNNRQAASQHVEDFRDCHEDFKKLVTRQRKVDESVVDGLLDELLLDPLASIGESMERTNHRLEREDLTTANIQTALAQIPASELRVAVKKEVEKGSARYKEEALIKQMILELDDIKAKRIGITEKQESCMSVSDPTAILALVSPFSSISSIPSILRLLTFSLSLYYWGVPLEILGRWLAIHKTTILRHLIGLSGCLWESIEESVKKEVKASIV